MGIKLLAAAALAFGLASPVMAAQCPADMAAIDEALAANPELSDETMAKVKDLRMQGEELHEAGDHAASVAALAEAKALLGVE